MRQFSADPPVQDRVGTQLCEADQTISVAESCTGGLLGALLTARPGASEYVERGRITYSNDAKLELGVSREALDEHGAVSEPVARELAQRIRDRASTDWGISITGVAGPTGGTEETPIGTVYIGIAYAADWGTVESNTTVEADRFDGDRDAVRERSARRALEGLETRLE